MGALACAGCTACCRDQLVVIVEEDGDPGQWETDPLPIDPWLKPISARLHKSGGAIIASGPADQVVDADIRVLKSNPDGSCIYLRDGGCSIYERRPAMCRAFDCRALVRDTLRGRFQLPIAHPVMAAGLKRLPSLDD